MKKFIAIAAGVSLILGLAPLAATSVHAKPAAEQRVETTKKSKPLPGCTSATPNIGGVMSLTLTMTDTGLLLIWKAPRTRAPWVVQGYKVYKRNPASGVMELVATTSVASARLAAEIFRSNPEGAVPLQVAAYGANPNKAGSGEEGCRADVSSGRATIDKSQRVPIVSRKQISCATLNDQVIITVAGFYKANAQVVKPAAFGLAIAIRRLRFARPLSKPLFKELRQAVSGWAREVVGPAAQLRITAMQCFRG